tara:strand:+ start:899 stop:1357 length:459 start_codon:yes stop_codon:yes gene_type:complete
VSFEAVKAYGLSLALMVAVVSPALRDAPEDGSDKDSFPFSDYPMFSHGRPDPMLTLTQALGVDGEGHREPLSPTISSGNYEVMQAMMTIMIAMRADGPGYCAEIAQRVAEESDLDHLEAVELATSTWDTVRYFEEGPEPLTRHVHHRCPVPR